MDLIGQKYDVSSVMKSGAIEKLTIGPDSLSPLVNFIQSAKKTILVENQYLKEPTLNAALIMASKRGVRVQIMVASVCSFGRPQNNEVKRLTSIFKSFDNAGIEIKMFNKNITINGKSGYLHAKAIVVDGNRAWMGSVNGSTQALTLNREFGIFFDDLIDVEKLKSTMVEDFTHPKAETWQDSLICAENEFI
jgi:phosphatidylserine/phosphatidylglycerophosphate/cardiolipin synthase-like enzyme